MIRKSWFFIFLVLTFFARPAFAQKVSKVLPDKGWVLVTFESTATIKAGQFACFLDDGNTTVACGKIVKVSTTVVVVKTSPVGSAAQVKPGFKMQISATQPLASVADVGASGVAAEKGKKKKSGGYSVRLVTAPGLGVFSVAKVGYVPPALGASGVSLWETTNKRINVEKISAGIEFLSRNWGQFGVRYAVYGDSEMKFSKALALQTDYDVTNRQKYVEASHTVSAFSGYYNYLFKKPAAGIGGLALSGGLDLTASTAQVDASLHDDADSSNSSLASIKSSLSVLSLQVGADYGFQIGKSFGLGVGIRALLPVAELGLTQTTTITDVNSSKSSDESADLMKALDHKKSSFGLLIPVFVSMSL